VEAFDRGRGARPGSELGAASSTSRSLNRRRLRRLRPGQSAEFLKKEQDIISKRLPIVDVVISTAQVFGKRPPVLITAEMLGLMRPERSLSIWQPNKGEIVN